MSFISKLPVLAVSQPGFNAPMCQSGLQKAHMLRLYGGARRTVNSGNSLLDFEKAVLVHIRVKGLWLFMWHKPQKLARI